MHEIVDVGSTIHTAPMDTELAKSRLQKAFLNYVVLSRDYRFPRASTLY